MCCECKQSSYTELQERLKQLEELLRWLLIEGMTKEAYMRIEKCFKSA